MELHVNILVVYILLSGSLCISFVKKKGRSSYLNAKTAMIVRILWAEESEALPRRKGKENGPKKSSRTMVSWKANRASRESAWLKRLNCRVEGNEETERRVDTSAIPFNLSQSCRY